jgi:hypothetical protein
MPDFPNLLKQFKETEDIEFVKLANKTGISPDQILYEIETNTGNLWVFEVDYIGSFENEVFSVIQRNSTHIPEFFEVKEKLTFEESGPVVAASVYEKPTDWEKVSKYASDKFGSIDYYFNFLAKAKKVV